MKKFSEKWIIFHYRKDILWKNYLQHNFIWLINIKGRNKNITNLEHIVICVQVHHKTWLSVMWYVFDIIHEFSVFKLFYTSQFVWFVRLTTAITSGMTTSVIKNRLSADTILLSTCTMRNLTKHRNTLNNSETLTRSRSLLDCSIWFITPLSSFSLHIRARVRRLILVLYLPYYSLTALVFDVVATGKDIAPIGTHIGCNYSIKR